MSRPTRFNHEPGEIYNLDADTVCLGAQAELLQKKLGNELYSEHMLGLIALDLDVIVEEIERR